MPVYKVEICGVNTSKLPLLSNEEKEDLFRRILKGDREAREALSGAQERTNSAQEPTRQTS